MDHYLRCIQYFIVILCVCFIFNSCQHNKRYITGSAIEADVTSNAELIISEYFENFRMLKLPTDVVMGEIHRIRYENNRIYISDRQTLFSFSDDGILLSYFQKIGRGPGEYYRITDFIVDGENIIILDRTLQNLITYNHSGEYISTRKLEYWAQAISPIVNDSYFFYCGNEYGPEEKHKLRRIKNGKDDSRYLPIDENQSKYLHINSNHYFYQHQEIVYFFEAFNDIVYESVGGGDIVPSLYVDFKGKNIPSSFFEKEYANIAAFFMEFHKTSYAYGVINFAVYNRFLMFGSLYQTNIKLTVFNQKDKISKTFSTIKDDIYFNGLTIPVSEFNYHANKHIFVPVNAFSVVEWKQTYPTAEQFKSLVNATNEEDNPLLLIFDFKQ